MKLPPFSSLVAESWSKAVSYASNNLEYYRNELIESLTSTISEERSAAVTSFNEANDAKVHDQIIKLIDDHDETVRGEVLEYLEDFGKIEDVKLIFDRIHDDLGEIYLKTSVLSKLTGREDGIIFDDHPKPKIEKEITAWREYLEVNGYI